MNAMFEPAIRCCLAHAPITAPSFTQNTSTFFYLAFFIPPFFLSRPCSPVDGGVCLHGYRRARGP